MDGDNVIIINRVIRVPYSSNVRLYCEGSGMVAWQFKNTEIGQLLNTYSREIVSNIDEDNSAVVVINKFNRKQRGFYSCQSVDLPTRMEETVLVTCCKFN